MADQKKNFAYSTVQTGSGVISSTSGASIILATGDGAKFPTPPFNVAVWPSSAQPLGSNAEIMRCTAISTDTLTVTRAQESTTALSGIAAGYQVDQAHTALNQQLADRFPGVFAIWETDFLSASSYFTATASGGSQAAGGSSQGHPGLLQLTSGTTAGGIAEVGLALAASSQSMHFNDNSECEFIFQMPSTITDTDVKCGLLSNSTVTPPTGVWVEKLAGDTHFWLKVGNSSTYDTRQDTGITPSANSWHSLIVGCVGATGQVYYQVDRAAPTFYTPTNMPVNGTGVPGLSIAVNATASSRSLNADFGRLLVSALGR